MYLFTAIKPALDAKAGIFASTYPDVFKAKNNPKLN
jgi:hypothetical protein